MEIHGKAWGHVSCLFAKNNVEVNRLVCKKGGKSSLHTHRAKHSMFYVESGTIAIHVEKNDYKLVDKTILKAGESTTLKPNEYHMFEVLKNAVCYEIYWTELDPNDIIRKNCGVKPK